MYNLFPACRASSRAFRWCGFLPLSLQVLRFHRGAAGGLWQSVKMAKGDSLANSQSQNHTPMMALVRPQFVLFGDSITEKSLRPGGWGAAFADTYSRKSCSTPPAAATIFFGANDAALLGRSSQRQHVPVEEYKENLRKIVGHLKECLSNMLVVLITPPPVDEDGRKEYARSVYGEKATMLPERTNEMTGVYARQCVQLAEELHIPCINLWSQMQETPGWQKKFLSDGLHLTAEGNNVVYKEILQVFNNAHLCAEEMPYDFPHHSEINGDQPEKVFRQKI